MAPPLDEQARTLLIIICNRIHPIRLAHTLATSQLWVIANNRLAPQDEPGDAQSPNKPRKQVQCPHPWPPSAVRCAEAASRRRAGHCSRDFFLSTHVSAWAISVSNPSNHQGVIIAASGEGVI